jgi:hypothetical protein
LAHNTTIDKRIDEGKKMTNKEKAKMAAWNAYMEISCNTMLDNAETRKAYAHYMNVCYTPDFLFDR